MTRRVLVGLDTIVTAVASVVLVALGGLVGTGGWRAPFWLYAVILVLAVLTARLAFVIAGVGLALPAWRLSRS